MLFFDHPVIYQAMTQPVDVDDEPGLESMEAWEPPVILRPRIAYLSSSVGDLVDFSEEQPGWEQAQEPEIVRRPGYYESIAVGDIFDAGDADVVEGPGWEYPAPPVIRRKAFFLPDQLEGDVIDFSLEGPGWDQAPPPPVILRPGYYLPDWTGDVEDFDEEQPGWIQAQDPEIVRRVPVFLSDWTGDVVEFSLEEPGWYVPGPPVVLRPGYYLSTIEEVLDVIAEQGEHGFWVDPPIVIRRPPFYLPLTTFDADVFVSTDTGVTAPAGDRPLVTAPGGALSAGQLARLRIDAAKALPDKCIIRRSQRQPDGQGGYTETNAAVYMDVRCRLSYPGGLRVRGRLPGGEVTQGGRTAPDAEVMLSLPFDVGIRSHDTVWVDGETFEVTFVNAARTLDTVRRVFIRRLG